jgi:GNAT superfamily N-acetyltransferase
VTYRSEPLNPTRHNLTRFDSSEPTLDTWLREHAAGAQDRRVGRTFVWVEDGGDPNLVVAYYTLTGHVLVRDSLPNSVGRGAPMEIPAVLVARLALDKSLHGFGHGAVLLVDALRRVLLATEQVAARFVVVDALHEQAADFYAHNGFKRIPDSLRLVQKISDVAAALDAAP